MGILKIPSSTFKMYGSIYLLLSYKWTGEMDLELILLKRLQLIGRPREKREKEKKKRGIPQTKQPAFGQQTVTYYAWFWKQVVQLFSFFKLSYYG